MPHFPVTHHGSRPWLLAFHSQHCRCLPSALGQGRSVVLLIVTSPLLSEGRYCLGPDILKRGGKVLFRSLDSSVSTVTRLQAGTSGVLRIEGSYCLSSSPVLSCFDCTLPAHSSVYTASTQFSVYCQHTVQCTLPAHSSVYTASTQFSVHCQHTVQCILPAHSSVYTASTQFNHGYWHSNFIEQ